MLSLPNPPASKKLKIQFSAGVTPKIGYYCDLLLEETKKPHSSQYFQQPHNIQFWMPEDQDSTEEDEEDLLSTLSCSHLLSATDILPLVMHGGEVSLDPTPSDSTLPISPIFICTNGTEDTRNQQLIDMEDQDLEDILAEVSREKATATSINATFELPEESQIHKMDQSEVRKST